MTRHERLRSVRKPVKQKLCQSLLDIEYIKKPVG